VSDPKRSALPEDRTDLATLWAAAVAEVDELTDALAEAQKKEAKVWASLRRSRSKTVSEDAP
jgi:hypothetical protein